MYITVRRFEGVTDPPEVARRVREGLVPLISQIPSFQAYYWVDAGNNVMVSISMFDKRAGSEEADRRAPAWVNQHIAALLPPVPPQITGGEVVAYRVKQTESAS
ncbi:MAG: hypothetical protein IMW89_15425 [Ktedonobacteraceae bacterium]|nr:hypothetical protein [Ktedonobacteraceae bacterium]